MEPNLTESFTVGGRRSRVNPMPEFTFAARDSTAVVAAAASNEMPSVFGVMSQSMSTGNAQSLLRGTISPELATSPAAGAAADGASPPNRVRRIAWRCAMCGYVTLAMDHKGRPLPLETDAFGRPLPLHCARCDVEHVEWETCVPFNEFGDYANIPSAFASTVKMGRAGKSVTEGCFAPDASKTLRDEQLTTSMGAAGTTATSINEILRIRDGDSTTHESRAAYLRRMLHETDSTTVALRNAAASPAQSAHGGGEKRLEDVARRIVDAGASEEPRPGGYATFKGVRRNSQQSKSPLNTQLAASWGSASADNKRQKRQETYACARCSRRLLRNDQFGNVVPLDVDAFGKIVALFCPGCKASHSDWVVRSVGPAAPGTQPQESSRERSSRNGSDASHPSTSRPGTGGSGGVANAGDEYDNLHTPSESAGSFL